MDGGWLVHEWISGEMRKTYGPYSTPQRAEAVALCRTYLNKGKWKRARNDFARWKCGASRIFVEKNELDEDFADQMDEASKAGMKKPEINTKKAADFWRVDVTDWEQHDVYDYRTKELALDMAAELRRTRQLWEIKGEMKWEQGSKTIEVIPVDLDENERELKRIRQPQEEKKE